MKVSNRINYIKDWIVQYCNSTNNQPSLIIGVSGGIDSSVTSTICAITGIKTITVSLPIKQNNKQHDLSIQHQKWLRDKFDNVKNYVISLDDIFSKLLSGNNPMKFMNLLQTVGSKIQNKVQNKVQTNFLELGVRGAEPAA